MLRSRHCLCSSDQWYDSDSIVLLPLNPDVCGGIAVVFYRMVLTKLQQINYETGRK